MQEHEGFHSWLIDMPTLENAIKSVHETSNSLMRWLALIIICYCVQADKFGENAFWSFDVVVQQGLICVWLLWEPVLTTRGSRSCVNASILHITCSRVLSHVWPLQLWFSQETPNWIHNAMSTTFPGSKNHHKGRFELRVCFTKVWCSPWSQESAATISSGSCQTSSHGFEILRRTVFPAPAPFRSIELFRLGRWALCHTADSFSRPTCHAKNIRDGKLWQFEREKKAWRQLAAWCLPFQWSV